MVFMQKVTELAIKVTELMQKVMKLNNQRNNKK